jgi:mRNA (guanine-N7-)-methyltransferase
VLPSRSRAKLKEYHNNVKRYLINTLAKRSRRGGAQSLLDLACGRGGDIDKWIDAGIREVHGVDISANEIELARKRFEMKKKKAHRLDPEYTFRATDALGETRVDWGRQYDIATCMFAGHFFLQTEQMLDAFLGNVAAGLRDGGYYFGTIASGRAVLELLDRRAM